MKKITDIKEQLKNKKRVSVYLDGEFYCGLDLITALKYRLKVGEFIDENRLIEIQYEAELQACFDRALNFISSSIKTQKQIQDKLKKLGYLDEIIEKVIDKLKSYGYVCDSDYAKRFASTYKSVKGKRLIKLELMKKGVKDIDAQTALNEIESQQDACNAIADKYLKNKEKDKKNILKCYKYLLSKGFDYDEAKQAVDRYEIED